VGQSQKSGRSSIGRVDEDPLDPFDRDNEPLTSRGVGKFISDLAELVAASGNERCCANSITVIRFLTRRTRRTRKGAKRSDMGVPPALAMF
jgi:hypothetical protein